MTLPDTMRVARLRAWGDVRVEEAPVPRPGPGEIVVRIEACGVCGSDALVWYVERKAADGGVVLGHEPVGTVAAAGPGVERFAPGDRVFVHHHAPCMRCQECRRGLWSSCDTWRATNLEPGGFAQYARVPATNVAHDTLALPGDMDWERGTFIEPLATGLRAVRRNGALRSHDHLLVIGLGSMGLLMTQLGRALGAAGVIGSDFLEARRRLAAELGADAALDPAAGDIAAAVRERTGGRGADVVIVCPGDERAVRQGLDAAAPGGRVVCFTPFPPDRPLTIDQSTLYFREVQLLQSYSCGPDETRDALRLLRDDAIRTEPLVTHRAGLDGVAEALERAAGKAEGIKTLVFPHLDA